MKNVFKFLFMSLLICLGSFSSNAAVSGDPVKDASVYSHIVNRVNEIQNLDKTELSYTEKIALRKELKTMKKQAGGLDKKVYLSVGAIIIIILLLILILN